MAVISYLRAHWRGELPLGTSLWINMLGGLLLLSLAELAWLSRLTENPESLVQMTLLSLLISRVIVFAWQLVGLLRSIEQDYLEHRDLLKTRLCQAIAVLTVVFTLAYSLEVIQGAAYYRHQLAVYTQHESRVDYQLELTADGRQLILVGGLEPGITTAVRSLLESQPDISAVVLESKGGQIYEGRGLARLFTEHGVDTYVFDECSSACATAFIGGKQRYLGQQGKLGFHRYRLDRSGFERIVPFYDLQAEQARDLALFEQRGVDQSFLQQMFTRPSEQLWYPDQRLLRDAGVVDRVVNQRP